MKIATWNVNGIKARIDAAQTWLKAASPDIALLQETKCVDDAFPRLEFEAMGYNIATHGQKGFNGVALLSKLPFDEVAPRLAGDPDDVQARYLEAVVSVPEARVGEVRSADAEVELWSEPGRRYPVELRELSPVADPATRTYEARFTLPEDAHPALGMSATVILEPAGGRPTVELPTSALIDTGSGPSVWVVGADERLEHPIVGGQVPCCSPGRSIISKPWAPKKSRWPWMRLAVPSAMR